ncbi:MAG: TerB N-terminal domain-containing protein [Clostridia bacterium]|nr:TerB N-terminal domain-containing protein [Clostridia bacterium]
MAEWEKKESAHAQHNSQRKLDDFWNVESLLPQKNMKKPTPPPNRSIEAVEIDVSAPAQILSPPVYPIPHFSVQAESQPAEPTKNTPAEATGSSPLTVHYIPPHKADEKNVSAPLLEYTPDGALLHCVRVYGWQANYHYFDSFVEDAMRFDAMTPPKSAEKTPFFSYFPQYVQLGRRATAWYLLWREHIRRGQYPDTDYSYILLYLFELINLPAEDIPTARTRRDLMAKVWMAYRKSFPQLDHYMCEWLCDYCLIHTLQAPVDLLSPALDDIIRDSRLKEFYLSAAVCVPNASEGVENTRMETARILLRHCCQSDYRKSKFAQGEHKSLFDSTIPAAVAYVLPLLLGADGRKPAITLLDSTVTRDAYVGALCSHRNKRRIEVAYTSFSRSHELRFLIGDMVKHVENRLRTRIGVRSRLSVMSLPIPLRDALDACLALMELPKTVSPIPKKEEPRPAYEALYDLPRKEVSLSDAAAIEAQSWETTKILVEAFEATTGVANDVPLRGNAFGAGAANEIATDVANGVAPAAQTMCPCGATEENAESENTASFVSYTPFIKAALDGNSVALRAAAKVLGKMPDALADEINALTADGEIGDIILEDDGKGSYTVIEDYRDAVLEMIEG